MSAVNILKFGISSPADTSPLEELKKAGYEPSQILAVIGKTEGNGCVNDFSRTLAACVWEPLIPEDAITIFSGGTEGVLSPHITFVVREPGSRNTGLIAAVARTRKLEPHEIGTRAQAAEVYNEVDSFLSQHLVGDAFADALRLVLVKCPLLTSDKISRIKASGREPVTADTYESMARSRYACAAGINTAVVKRRMFGGSELVSHLLSPADDKNGDYSRVSSAYASCSSGAELEDCHILLLAESAVRGKLRAVSTVMRDAIDAASIQAALATVRDAGGEVVQVFAKAEADPAGTIRGKRHTMSTDSDVHGTRHARAAVGGLIAGLTGDTQVYVSGGAEGQGPSGGGSLCVVYRVP